MTLPAVALADTTVQPIDTRYARIQAEKSIELIARSFTDLELQEADLFDGWTAVTEVVVPYGAGDEDKQIRFSIPVYTDGDARLTEPTKPDVGADIEINGYGGVFDFVSVQLEYGLSSMQESGYNSAYYYGFGIVLVPLDTTTSDSDLFNHEGYNFVAGYRYDRPLSLFGSETQLLLNAGVRIYFSTDDLIQDTFTWADLKGAIVFDNVSESWMPVLELTYFGDPGEYDELLLKPEAIVPFGDRATLKLGAIVSLSDDGNQDGYTASFSYDF